MEMEDIIRQAEANIRQAVEDYGEHTWRDDVLEDISDTFIRQLAEDSSYAKRELRELFSKSPAWHPELDALIINGNRTHDPNYCVVEQLATMMLSKAYAEAHDDDERRQLLREATYFFVYPNNEALQDVGIAAIKKLAPNAYHPGKKRSRIFKALCVALGVADEKVGSDFQKLYAQFADELSSRKLGFKLFVSINPAHFLTMSNPKDDERGECLTSCHSLNSTDYQYNCGCTGYARDETSFLVFTVADPDDAETLNNRKTTRQLFAYRPGNGVLLQSRMYDTQGGTRGTAKDSALYRDLIQREISMLEDKPNLWKVYDATEEKGAKYVDTGDGFGGYPDWEYDEFDCRVCIRFDHLANAMPIVVGTYGLCVKCADEISENMYCSYCDDSHIVAYCDDCEEGVTDEDDLYEVFDEEGHRRYVCQSCLDNGYTRCDHCEEYRPNSVMEHVDGWDVCPDCLEQRYTYCDDCGSYCRNEEAYRVTDQYGDEVYVCEDCKRDHYETCACCEDLFHEDLMCDALDENGTKVRVCGECFDRYGYVSCEDEDEAEKPENELKEAV